ncbi:MAG: hypothetical protein DHS20C19_16040 [Acidimicrobiales bacterium]|nr:MAG: hypothetical protein DHS20C19_16040 [Acidimicrobiales bacterium]
MLDSVNLERMGIPSVVVVVEQFVTAARATARALGMPDVSLLVVPQDYLGEDRAHVHAVLEPLVGELLDKLFVSG